MDKTFLVIAVSVFASAFAVPKILDAMNIESEGIVDEAVLGLTAALIYKFARRSLS